MKIPLINSSGRALTNLLHHIPVAHFGIEKYVEHKESMSYDSTFYYETQSLLQTALMDALKNEEYEAFTALVNDRKVKELHLTSFEPEQISEMLCEIMASDNVDALELLLEMTGNVGTQCLLYGLDEANTCGLDFSMQHKSFKIWMYLYNHRIFTEDYFHRRNQSNEYCAATIWGLMQAMQQYKIGIVKAFIAENSLLLKSLPESPNFYD